MMTEEERISQIKGYQERQPELALTFTQAKFLFENDANIRFRVVPFSTWELLDYEYEIYRQILSDSQFELFETGWKERQQQTKVFIAGSDERESEWEMGYFADLLRYREDHFWPEIKQIPFFRVTWPLFEEEKTTLLRASYRRYLEETIAERIARHFRDFRRFAPLRLRLVEVKNDLERLQPHYGAFYRRSDEAVRAVFDFLRKQIESWDEESLPELDQVIQKWEEFEREAFAKRPVRFPTAVVSDHRTRKQRQTDMLLNLLLVNHDEMPG
ncbi:hypothetical protein [Siphonobacter aquaeclarae]|uniref:Uncharacterized protein n=1 Tax=Siphonobacter aquaeclarae TaxID=563176 RepID=A0A1G9IA09_9BACT|nr:hypothetical protein [Siphonobacter aquaeclarae]SDL22057.1 hypothetical protein SAMN04488090_0393 [Siphonobacter aquaeclarae]